MNKTSIPRRFTLRGIFYGGAVQLQLFNTLVIIRNSENNVKIFREKYRFHYSGGMMRLTCEQ